jgi:hypothetical protein
VTAHANSTRVRAVLAELERECDRARSDTLLALRDRFVPDSYEPDEEGGGAEGTAGVTVAHSSAGEDLRGIIADYFDWPMERAWRKAKAALR